MPQTYTFASWNVNGLRAVLKKDPSFIQIAQELDVDILALQETKLQEGQVVAVHDPIVEQIDRGADRIHRLHGVVAQGNRLVGRRTRRTKQECTRRQRDGQNPQDTLCGIGFSAKRL